MRTIEPSRIAKGERVEWTRTFADAPASLYTIEYRFRGGGTGINVTATADGDAHVAAITASASATFGTTGKYRWQAWATEIADATNTFVVASGILIVDPGFAAGSTAAVDVRSTAKQILDAIDAAMLSAATSTQLEVEVSTPAGSRRIKNMSRKELIDSRQYYAKIVATENAAERTRNGGKFGTQVVVNVREK